MLSPYFKIGYGIYMSVYADNISREITDEQITEYFLGRSMGQRDSYFLLYALAL